MNVQGCSYRYFAIYYIIQIVLDILLLINIVLDMNRFPEADQVVTEVMKTVPKDIYAS